MSRILFSISPYKSAVNQTLTSIAVTPSGTTTLNENAQQPFTATALDQFVNALTSQPTFTWTSSGVGSVDGSGLYTAPASTGSATVTATSGSVSGNASVNVGNAAPTVATSAAASPSTVTGTTAALSVLGADDGGESNLTYAWSATSVPSGSAAPTFSATGTNAAKNVTATFTKNGAYTLKATITDAGGSTVTSSVNVTVNQTLTSISVTPGTATLGSAGTQQFTATALDQFGMALTSQPTITWANSGAGSVNATGLYTASTSTGSGTVTATSASVSGSAAVTVGGPTVASPATASFLDAPSIIQLGALGSDPNGESTLTYTWTAISTPAGAAVNFGDDGDNSAKSTSVGVNLAGTYTFEVTISDGTNSVTSDVNFTISQVLTNFVMNQPGVAIYNSGTTAFSVAAYDQFGNSMTVPSLTWTAGSGSVDGGGGYTAPPSGTGSDTVTVAGGGISASSTQDMFSQRFTQMAAQNGAMSDAPVTHISRSAFTCTAVASAIVCAALCGLWARSYFDCDSIVYQGDARSGCMPFARADSQLGSLSGRYITDSFPPGRSADYRRAFFGENPWRKPGFCYTSFVQKGFNWQWLGVFSWQRVVRPSVFHPPDGPAFPDIELDRSYMVPHWAISAIFAVVPGAWLQRRGRRLRRARMGLCPSCGYDLRASTSRCPECGARPGLTDESPRILKHG